MNPTPAQLEALREADPALGAAMSRLVPFPGFPVGETARGSHFESLARSIVFQQLATNAARSIYDRARAITPGPRFPNPPQVLETSDERFRQAGLSAAKTKAIKALATCCEDGTVRLRKVGKMEDAEVIEMLTQVWGVGEWTAQMFLIFRLGRLDVMPAGDLGVREGAKRLYQLETRPTPKDLLERSELWRPLRSVATWVLYRVCDE
ncbi:MAG: DNA-3-methyladenine glycosylase family protein [Longimicrobiales bacterium]